MQTLYNMLVRAETTIRHLMDDGALMTYPEFAVSVGLMGPNEPWSPARQKEVADILKYLGALERRLQTHYPLDFKRILSPTQVRLLRGEPDDAA